MAAVDVVVDVVVVRIIYKQQFKTILTAIHLKQINLMIVENLVFRPFLDC